jgi:hypothetical protein
VLAEFAGAEVHFIGAETNDLGRSVEILHAVRFLNEA